MPEFPQQVHALLVRLEAAGFAAYLVGGCVRDLLMGRQPVDWDAATSARPEQVLELFAPDALPTGLQHGTVTVSLDGCRCSFIVSGQHNDLDFHLFQFIDGPFAGWFHNIRRTDDPYQFFIPGKQQRSFSFFCHTVCYRFGFRTVNAVFLH